jgi:eukaryotic translation initiation factor 2C
MNSCYLLVEKVFFISFLICLASETENVLHASSALSVALRHVPSMLYTPVGSEFYSPISRTPISGGLEVWRGFHQSVKALMAGHLGINVDIASTVFRKGAISLIDYILEVGGVRDVNDISRMRKEELLKVVKGTIESLKL